MKIMKYLSKIEVFLSNAIRFIQSEKTLRVMAIIIVVFQIFAVGFVFAADDDGELKKLSADIIYDNKHSTKSLGVDPEEQNNLKKFTDDTSAFVALGGSVLCRDCFVDSALANAEYGEQKDLLGMMDQLNSDLLYNPPNANVVAHLSEEWVPGSSTADTSVYAGGYEYLQSMNISEMSERVRMFAYLIFVVVLIVAGFMIMFRQKIGGQVMVSLFNTLPKVVIGLILVTFSFAIAGLILDVGAVLMTVVAALLDLGGDEVYVTGPFSLIEIAFTGLDDNALPGGVATTAGITSLASFGIAALLAFGGATGGTGFIIVGILAGLIALVVIGVLFYASLKVYITLIKAYLGIILDVILGPIILAMAVVPGKGNLGYGWFYRLIKNTLTFVGVFLLVNLAFVFYRSDIVLAFPTGLSTGNLDDTANGASLLNAFLKVMIPIMLLFLAAEVPKFLDDFLPSNGGKGAASAMQNVQKTVMSKIPGLG